LMSDDDFFIQSAVKKCIGELEKDDTLLSCYGCGAGFDFNKERKDITAWDFGKKINNYNFLLEEDPTKRLLDHMIDYEPVLVYAVTRSDQIRQVLTSVLQKKFDFFTSFEIQYEMLMSFAGKGKLIKDLYWLRSAENLPHYNNFKYKNIEPKREFKYWFHQYPIEKNLFIKIMADSYKKLLPDIDVDFEDIAIQGSKAYISYRRENPENRSIVNLRNMLRFYTPSFIRKIRDLIRGAKANSFDNEIVELQASGVNINLIDLNKVKKAIYKFYTN